MSSDPPPIEDCIRDYVTQVAKLGQPPGDHDKLADRGFISSIRLLDLVGFLEDTYRIRLRPVDLTPEKLATIAQIAQVVSSRIKDSRR